MHGKFSWNFQLQKLKEEWVQEEWVECSELRDCLGERALVMTGRWFRKELLPIQKSLRGKLVPIPLIILSENSWFTNEILTTGQSLLKGNLRKRSLLNIFLVASLE